MFKTITLKDERTFVLKTENIAFIGEKHQAPSYLYDENGNVAQTIEPTEKVYELVIILDNGFHKALVIGQGTYDELVKELTK